jgi:hypothetical protein
MSEKTYFADHNSWQKRRCDSYRASHDLHDLSLLIYEWLAYFFQNNIQTYYMKLNINGAKRHHPFE